MPGEAFREPTSGRRLTGDFCCPERDQYGECGHVQSERVQPVPEWADVTTTDDLAAAMQPVKGRVRSTSKVCACVADGVRCKQPVEYGNTLCRSCRLHHTRPFGPNPERVHA